MSFETAITGIVQQATGKAANLVTMFEAGDIGLQLFLDSMGQLVDQARAQGSAKAVQILRGYVESALDGPVVVSPTMPPEYFQRLTKALTTILGSDKDTRMQIERLVRGEITQAAQDAYADSMKNIPEVEGWVRGLDSGACELCRWWWREGRVFRPEHRMPTHTGCLCHPVPTVRKTRNFQTDRQADRAAAMNRQRAEARTAKED